jgi:peptidoglycan/xylan/chitin deacetylase (PgdA/CDA1 family)
MKNLILNGFRPDRFISCHVVHPVLKMLNVSGGVPILMYHNISWERGGHPIPYFETNTFPSVFEEHMRFLAAEGYKPAGLECLIATGAEKTGSKHVVITFDDGYLDFYRNAFPILRRHGATATVFLPTGYISTPRKMFKQRPCLNWNEIRELSQNGISFGSHSQSHGELRNLCPKGMEDELRISKEIVENMTGMPVHSFSYPYAFPQAQKDFVRLYRAALIDAGYKFGVTTRIGLNSRDSDFLTLKRIPASSHDDPLLFAAKLEGAYDWLHSLQTLFKKSRELSAMEF